MNITDTRHTQALAVESATLAKFAGKEYPATYGLSLACCMLTSPVKAEREYAKPKKAKMVSHAKPEEQTALPLPAPNLTPDMGMMQIHHITVNDQVRKDFDQAALEELALDIARHGILAPLTVRRIEDGYLLVAGERRLRAAKMAGLVEVPVIVTTITDDDHDLAQLAENIQRADLSLSEEAAAIEKLYAKIGSVSVVATRLHKSVSWVSKRLSLSRGLGFEAAALMAERVTEDIELLQTVDKVAKATPGTNSAWALAQKIRKGEAGREEAREVLRRATEPKKTGDEPGKAPQPVKEDPLQQSKWFREWMMRPNNWNDDYKACLFQLMNQPGAAEHIERLENAIRSHEAQIVEAREAIALALMAHAKTTRESMGSLALHEAWVQYAKSKDPHAR